MLVDTNAPGRLSSEPVAIVDIGSNSVRLVAYEALSRALTPIFNEKVLCGLGRGVATTGLLAQEAMDKAIGALRCFRIMCRNMAVKNVIVLATAAMRDARNGSAFLDLAREAIGTDISLIDGAREAELSAKGVISGFYRPDGIVGDLGGGSLELIDVAGAQIGYGVSLPIGGLALSDLSKDSPKRAVRIVRDALAAAGPLDGLRGRTFYAVGGTWRALAKLHMSQTNYPLHVMQGYAIPASDPTIFHTLIERAEGESGPLLASVSAARRPLLAYGAVVLEEIIRAGKPKDVVVSTLGVREGMLFERLSDQVQATDPLLAAAREFNVLRSRSPGHAEDLCAWTDVMMSSGQFEETPEQKRLRHVACLMSDTSWRAHPDYRSDQAFSTIANAAFVGIEHPGRCFLALTVNTRHEGPDGEIGPALRALMSTADFDRARLIGGAMRVAFQLTSAMAGVLPSTPLRCSKTRLTLTLRPNTADLASARLHNRLKQLAKMVNRDAQIEVAG